MALKTLSKQEQFILFALGQSYQSFNKRFADKPLEVSISKPVFIDLLISSKSVEKKSRALYKNLEQLEKKKFIKYKKNELHFTKKGFDSYAKMIIQTTQRVELMVHMAKPSTLKLHKKLQTKLKN